MIQITSSRPTEDLPSKYQTNKPFGRKRKINTMTSVHPQMVNIALKTTATKLMTSVNTSLDSLQAPSLAPAVQDRSSEVFTHAFAI